MSIDVYQEDAKALLRNVNTHILQQETIGNDLTVHARNCSLQNNTYFISRSPLQNRSTPQSPSTLHGYSNSHELRK